MGIDQMPNFKTDRSKCGVELNITFKKVVLPGRVKCGSTEGEIEVAHGRLPSHAPLIEDVQI